MEPIYATQTDLTLEEYEKYDKAMMGTRKKNQIIEKVLIALMLIAAVLYMAGGSYMNAVIYAATAIFVPLLFRLIRRKRIEKAYSEFTGTRGNIITISFYDDYLEAENKAVKSSYQYSMLHSVLETETNFYIMPAAYQGVIVQKKNCSAELIEFIQGVVAQKKNCSDELMEFLQGPKK